jgi:hypothetical protein
MIAFFFAVALDNQDCIDGKYGICFSKRYFYLCSGLHQ